MHKDQTLYQRTFGNHYLISAVSLILILIFMGLLLERIDREFEQAESIQFEHRLSELKAAVRLMEAALISQGEMQLADKFEGANPFDWLEDNTSHYLGSVSAFEALNYPGYWFFDQRNKQLAYVSSTQKASENSMQSEAKILRFKVRALRSKEELSKFTGLALVRIPQNKEVEQ